MNPPSEPDDDHMTSVDDAAVDDAAGDGPGEPPRLGPRPLDQPRVDPDQAAFFGRPSGVDGAFATGQGTANGAAGLRHAPPPPEALASAFGRPAGTGGGLQRPPGAAEPPVEDDPFWRSDAERDPWRNPGAMTMLGDPALRERPDHKPGTVTDGARLSLRELLFGRRLSPVALTMLAVVALLVGAAGGLVGRLTAEEGSPLTDPDATLAQVDSAVDRPAGSVAAVADQVLPAVVSIEFRVGQEGGFGSGVVIDEEGYVLTNNHVVSPVAETQGASLDAIFSDGTRTPARIVGRDPKTDLAVIKVDVANPTVARLGRSAQLQAGDTVIAIGSPLGLAGTVTTGIVSAVDRPVRLEGEGADTNAVIDAVQTDAAINPGNSGGALVNASGAVVGINTAIRTLGGGEGGGSIGLGFAIPIDDARVIAEGLIRSGQFRHADLGVNAASVTDGTSDGARVQNVREGSAAAQAGIVENDVITRVGERAVGSADELVVAVRDHDIGDRVEISLVRDSRPLTVTATLQSD